MSSRQLRKLQQQRELEQAKLGDKETATDSEDEDNEVVQPVNKTSLFANFAALQDDDDDNDENETDKEDEGKEIRDKDETSGEVKEQTVVQKQPKKSKKKKKKTKSKPQMANAAAEAQSAAKKGSDEIDAALEALNIERGKRNTMAEDLAPALDPEYERICALLGTSSQHLKVANEMKSLFGRTATENHDDAGGPVGRGARRRQRGVQQVDLETALKGHHAPGKGLPEITLRRNIFIQGKDHWPRASTAGLTMEVVDDQAPDGTIEFRFVHDRAYNAVQQQFNMFVEMGDPQNLIGLLQRNPYHISLLLQVSKIAKDQTDHALSSDLVERALFTFARASLSSFTTKVSQGKARLDFARPENRELWLAGYQYIKSLIMKGTYRTALEWAKLLLSLDPEQDPYCMLLMIHHLAIRAHEFRYLLDLGPVSILEIRDTSGGYTKPSLALAAMHLKQGAECRRFLGDSIRDVPWLFCKLFQELGLDSPPPSIWGTEPRTDAEVLFTELYVRQTKDLWNTPEATALLMEVAHATKKLPDDEPNKADNNKITLNVARFVYLDNTPALMAMVPSHLMHRVPNSDSDPLPPYENIFSWDSQRQAFAPRNFQPSDMFGDHVDPFQALRRLIPGWTGTDPEVDERAIGEVVLREGMEDPHEAEGNELEGGPEENASHPRGIDFMNRLHALFFGRADERPAETEDADSTEESDEGASEEEQENGEDSLPH
ncbi:MAG: hypothetical protein M1818_006372 [Claussenomyces sp. TS43310]|nr:MAG: hypothetical protein M1818_006372 [Claussenomyces sp. TS43310]